MDQRLFVTFAALLCAFFGARGQPDWTRAAHRQTAYPEIDYLRGFNSEKNSQEDPSELLNRLKGYARNQLLEGIVVEIKSISMLNVTNMDQATREDFRKMSVAFSKASIAGLKTESFYDEKESTGYAFVYARKEDVIQYYTHQVNGLVDQIQLSFEMVNGHKSSGDNQAALRALFQIQTLIREAENAQTLLVTLTGDYNSPEIQREKTNTATLRVEEELNTIRSLEQLSVEDVALLIAYGLKSQLKDMGMPIRVSNFTFEDTPMSSVLSRRLQSALTIKLVEQGFEVIDNVYGQALIVQGTYWPDNTRLKISAVVRDHETSATIGCVDSYIPKSSLNASGIRYLPDNYDTAMDNLKLLAENEVKNGDLMIDVSTNKGRENLIYREGEIMKLFVRANRECYMRFIYHLADGSRVLLLDNYHISKDQVNQTFELPYEFECAAPFGAETLQLNAQQSEFDPLTTQDENGYMFILNEGRDLLANTRGFKTIQKSPMRAEKRLVFTTMQ